MPLQQSVVGITALNAVNSLYLTHDLYFAASFVESPIVQTFVDNLHAKQPRTEDFHQFSAVVNEALEKWETNTDPAVFMMKKRFGEIAMMATDLSDTYFQIKRAMVAAFNVAMAIRRRTQQFPETSPYPRVIPRELAEMRIEKLSEITIDTFIRILGAEPWRSWIDNLRGQRQRTSALLMNGDLLHLGFRGTAGVMRVMDEIHSSRPDQLARYRKRVKAQKSIRKSIKMFERLDDLANLRAFLDSTPENPMRINGCSYDYNIVAMPGTLIRSTIDCNSKMTVVHNQVLNKLGQPLCEICLYFNDTPVLDTVMAIALAVSNPETEIDMLKAACVVDTQRWFFDDPVLPELKGLSDPTMVPMIIQNILYHYNTLPEVERGIEHEFGIIGLPMAYSAFVRILRPGKRYLPIMRLCSEFELWSYMENDKEAMQRVTLAQHAVERGTY